MNSIDHLLEVEGNHACGNNMKSFLSEFRRINFGSLLRWVPLPAVVLNVSSDGNASTLSLFQLQNYMYKFSWFLHFVFLFWSHNCCLAQLLLALMWWCFTHLFFLKKINMTPNLLIFIINAIKCDIPQDNQFKWTLSSNNFRLNSTIQESNKINQ